MRVLISGAGIAGLGAAFWLRRLGHEVTIVEQARALRGQGYMIDFFGPGYEVAEKMEITPYLERIHYPIDALRFLNGQGQTRFSVRYPAFRRLLHNRHFNFMRGDLERLLYSLVQGTDLRFGISVASVHQTPDRVEADLSDGSRVVADILIGADGIHSQVRSLVFGEERQFLRGLGYDAAAFILDLPPAALGIKNDFYSATIPGRQVSLYPIRGERTATFFVHRSRRDALEGAVEPRRARDILAARYAAFGWVVPRILEASRSIEQIYFDTVAQVVMPSWSCGRVLLAGDAAHCVSLMAGQGSSLAMAGAYVLADALHQHPTDLARACAQYEQRLRGRVTRLQRTARQFARYFVAETAWQGLVRDFSLRLVERPLLWRLARRQFSDTAL